MAYSCFFGWGDVSGVFFWRLGVFFAQARLDVVSFSLALCVALPPQALSRPGRGCRTMAQCWWLFASLFVAVACRLPNLLLYLRLLSLRYSFGCAVLAAIAPLPFAMRCRSAMALLPLAIALLPLATPPSAGDPSFRWRPLLPLLATPLLPLVTPLLSLTLLPLLLAAPPSSCRSPSSFGGLRLSAEAARPLSHQFIALRLLDGR